MAKNKNKKNLDPKPAKVDNNSGAKTEEAGAEDNDKLKELESRLLTSLAENENLRKRFDREKEDLSNYVISNFAKEILSVLDNLQRAIASVKNLRLNKLNHWMSNLIRIFTKRCLKLKRMIKKQELLLRLFKRDTKLEIDF